jgi:hypothetical protein
MQNRILHKRLHYQLRDGQLARVVMNFPTEFKPVLQAYFLKAEVVLNELQFFVERDEIGVAILKNCTEQARDLENHGFGARFICVNESRDSLERIKQEMRMKLNFQGLEFARRERLLQLRALEFLLPRSFEILVCMSACENNNVVPDSLYLQNFGEAFSSVLYGAK